MTTRPAPQILRSLQLRLSAQTDELAEVSASSRPDGVKALMARCIEESLADTRRQIAEVR
jgi:hypothetical protein